MDNQKESHKKRAVSWIGIALDELAIGVGLGVVFGALMDRQRKKKQDQDEGGGEE